MGWGRRGSGGLASVSPLGGGLGLEKPQADYPQGFWAQAVTWAPLLPCLASETGKRMVSPENSHIEAAAPTLLWQLVRVLGF